MKFLRTPHFWLGLSSLVFLIFLLVNTQAVDLEQHDQFSRELRRVNELDAVITQNMLKSRFGLITNYDPLVRDLAELKQIQSDLAQLPSFIDHSGQQQFNNTLEEYGQIITQKERFLGDFKSRHAIYKNSLSYILLISTTLAQNSSLNDSDPQLMRELNSLMQHLLIYNSTSDDQISSQIGLLREQINTKQTQYQPRLDEIGLNLPQIMSHSEVILTVNPQLDRTIEEISLLPTAQAGERLIKVYHYHYQRAVQSSNFYRFVLYLFSLAVLGYVASVIIMRLRKAEQLLAQYNDNLEKQVSQRTTQLAKANEEIRMLNEGLQTENLRLGAEINISRQLQQMLLPSQAELGDIDGLDIAGFMEPADEVGGDYYDVLEYNGHVKIGIGDVTGHGLESGMLMLMTQTAVRTLLISEERNPARFLNILNRTIYDNVQRMKADKSLSLALLDYSPSGHVRLSGQHEELIVVRQGGKVELIDTMNLGFPVGLDDDITDFVNEILIKLEEGDGVVLYTDGITEAENMEKEQYGLERMCEILSRHWHQSAEGIKQAIIDDLHQYIGLQTIFDDITLLVLKQK